MIKTITYPHIHHVMVWLVSPVKDGNYREFKAHWFGLFFAIMITDKFKEKVTFNLCYIRQFNQPVFFVAHCIFCFIHDWLFRESLKLWHELYGNSFHDRWIVRSTWRSLLCTFFFLKHIHMLSTCGARLRSLCTCVKQCL